MTVARVTVCSTAYCVGGEKSRVLLLFYVSVYDTTTHCSEQQAESKQE